MSHLIEARNIRFAWLGTQTNCVEIERLDVAAGEAVFVHGPSGCGKSTLLSLLCGVLIPQSGSISLLGRDWRGMNASSRDAWRVDHAGYIFQQFNLLPYLTAVDNVLLPCRFSRMRRQRANSAGTLVQQAQALLEQVGLDASLWNKLATSLSVGQQQRVAAARALIGQPEVMVADEPTSAFDDAARENFMNLLRQACQQAGSALVFVSHDMRLSTRFDRVIDFPALNRARDLPTLEAA